MSDPRNTNEPIETPPVNRFRFFPQLNNLADPSWLRSNAKLSEKTATAHFNSDSLQDVLIQAIADQRVLSIKEVIETFEFFARARKTIKADCVADLCCGHGLLGYPKSACDAPLAIRTAFGLSAAYDIDRTYRLEAAGYLVRWMEIPKLITPMNRILIARKPKF